jgi:hypothetical protein
MQADNLDRLIAIIRHLPKYVRIQCVDVNHPECGNTKACIDTCFAAAVEPEGGVRNFDR